MKKCPQRNLGIFFKTKKLMTLLWIPKNLLAESSVKSFALILTLSSAFGPVF